MRNWNKKRFSVYDSEEKNVLGLLKDLGNLTNEVVEDNKYLNDKKLDIDGNFMGSWKGITDPALSDPGISGSVIKNREDIAKHKEIFDNEVSTIKNDILTKADLKYTYETLDNKMDKNTTNISITQINKDLGKIDSTYLSDTLLKQITGTTPISPNVADNSITLNKIDTNLKSDLYEINKKIIYGQLTLLKENPNVQYSCIVSTSSAITIYKNGVKWSFDGVTNEVVAPNEWLYCDLSLDPNNSVGYSLKKGTPTQNKKDKVIVLGNFYGKYFTDLLYEKRDANVEKLQFKTTMLGFKNSNNTKITFNESERKLKVEGDGIYLRRNPYESSNLKSILIPPFEYTLNNFEVVYVKLNEIDFSTQEIPLEKVRKCYVYETGGTKFNPIEDVPIFWYSNGILSNNLGLEVEKIGYSQNNLNVVCFGDSLTELDFYPDKMAKLTGYNVFDCSFAGSVMSYHNDDKYQKLGLMEISKSIVSGDFTPQRNAIDGIVGGSNKEPNFNTLSTLDFNKIDICVVLYGTNDWGNGGKLGDVTDTKETKSLVGGMKMAIENILSKYPHLQFYFISPPYREGWANLKDGKNLKQWGDTICEVANLYGFPSMNGISNLGINENNRHYYLDADKLHLNSNGDSLLAKKIGNFIRSK